MSKITNLPDKIHKIALVYHDGIVCPAEMWRMVADVIESSETRPELSSFF